MMFGRLDLSDAQRTRLREIMDSHRTENQELADREFKARTALDAAIAGATFDEGAVRSAAAALAAVDADAAVGRARVYAEAFQILTPDQQAQAKKQQEEMRSRQEQMRANRGQRQQQRQ